MTTPPKNNDIIFLDSRDIWLDILSIDLEYARYFVSVKEFQEAEKIYKEYYNLKTPPKRDFYSVQLENPDYVIIEIVKKLNALSQEQVFEVERNVMARCCANIHRMPAKEFEQKFDLKNIAKNYKLMGGYSAEHWEIKLIKPLFNKSIKNFFDIFKNKEEYPAKIQEKLKSLNPIIEKTLNQLNGFLDNFIENNPELKKISINRNDIDEAKDVLIGITSGFNVDDIKYFLSRKNTKTKREDEDKLKKNVEIKLFEQITHKNASLEEILYNYLFVQIEWRASPKTLNKIKKQICSNCIDDNQGFFGKNH